VFQQLTLQAVNLCLLICAAQEELEMLREDRELGNLQFSLQVMEEAQDTDRKLQAEQQEIPGFLLTGSAPIPELLLELEFQASSPLQAQEFLQIDSETSGLLVMGVLQEPESVPEDLFQANKRNLTIIKKPLRETPSSLLVAREEKAHKMPEVSQKKGNNLLFINKTPVLITEGKGTSPVVKREPQGLQEVAQLSMIDFIKTATPGKDQLIRKQSNPKPSSLPKLLLNLKKTADSTIIKMRKPRRRTIKRIG